MPGPYDIPDIQALLAGQGPNPVEALAAALRARQVGGILQGSGNKGLMEAGQGLERGGEADLNRSIQRQHLGMQYAPQLEQMEARKSPQYAQLLGQQAGQMGLELPQGTPPMVAEKALDRQEKLMQAQMMAQFRLGQQGRMMQKLDPNTGEIYLLRAIDGATFNMDGSPRSHGVAGGGLAGFNGGTGPSSPHPSMIPGAVNAAAPRPQPGPQGPAEPPNSTPPMDRPGDTTMAPTMQGGGRSGVSPFPRMMGKPLGTALQALGKDFDPNASGGELQKNQARLNAAIRLRALVTNEDGSIKENIPPQFMRETAMALAQLISAGGQPAQNLIDELTPHTKSGKWAEAMQWITDNPQNAGQQGFVKLYLESANREAQKAQEALNKGVTQRIGKHQRVVKGNPQEARDTLRPYGWDLNEQGELVPAQTQESAMAPSTDAASLRKKYGL